MKDGYDVHMYLPLFKSLFIVQNSNAQKMAGIMLAGISIGVLVLLALMGDLFEDVGMTGLFVALLFACLSRCIRRCCSEGAEAWLRTGFLHHGIKTEGVFAENLTYDHHLTMDDFGFVEAAAQRLSAFWWFVHS